MSLKFCSISSGSSGNCYLIGSDNTLLLVDAGISAKKITEGLASLGFSPSDLSGILITHEHSDHIKSAETLNRKYGVPLYINDKTRQALLPLLKKPSDLISNIFYTGEAFHIQDVKIKPFSIPHDAVEPVGFSFFSKKAQISTATDIGYISQDIMDEICSADLLVLEANHDVDMLKMGRYPWFLKQRILGKFGHLSNEDAALAILSMMKTSPKDRQILLAHLSKENNFPQMAYQTVINILEENNHYIGKQLSLDMLLRDERSPIYDLI